MLDRVEILLRNNMGFVLPVHFDVYDNSLSRKWLDAFNSILDNNLHLEKNYCFFGFPDSPRDLHHLAYEINQVIAGINASSIDYNIDDFFSADNMVEKNYSTRAGKDIIEVNHEKFNQLHLYFEDTQGVSGAMSKHYESADAETRWYIRQLNLLCHEAECLVLSLGRQQTTPEWVRPSNVMCWLHAPRFVLEEEDYKLFGIDTIARDPGGVYVGVNKAVGKHHYEVFSDEGGDSRIDELTTTTLKPQTEAAGDFDIEWGKATKDQKFMQTKLNNFRTWLVANNFDPDDPSLTIGHPKIGQVDMQHTFGTDDFAVMLTKLSKHLDVFSIKTSKSYAEYDYTWEDSKRLQVPLL